MSVRSHLDATASADWSDFVDELDRWGKAGHVATLWWRDDDAVAMTPALARLLSVAGPAPLALAVIPAAAEASLAAALRGRRQVAILQHGWSHANHGTDKKSEFPPERSAAEVEGDLIAGGERLTRLFGETVPVLAPPWNRLAPEFEALLPRAGIAALSTMASHRGDGAERIDVHVDLVAWKAGRGFIGEEAALGGIVGELRQRRLGLSPIDRATGILTHHLIMDDATEAFAAALGEAIAGHRAARWSDIREALP